MKIWTNEAWTKDPDVVKWLEQKRNKELTLKDVAANILRDFGRKFCLKAISNHVTSAEEKQNSMKIM